MHFRSAVDIVPALLFSPKPSSFAALFERKFWPWGCFDGGQQILFLGSYRLKRQRALSGCKPRFRNFI
jgi:hypothetical protein